MRRHKIKNKKLKMVIFVPVLIMLAGLILLSIYNSASKLIDPASQIHSEPAVPTEPTDEAAPAPQTTTRWSKMPEMIKL